MASFYFLEKQQHNSVCALHHITDAERGKNVILHFLGLCQLGEILNKLRNISVFWDCAGQIEYQITHGTFLVSGNVHYIANAERKKV